LCPPGFEYCSEGTHIGFDSEKVQGLSMGFVGLNQLSRSGLSWGHAGLNKSQRDHLLRQV
jgi:hypothetical protein